MTKISLFLDKNSTTIVDKLFYMIPQSFCFKLNHENIKLQALNF